MRAMALFAAVGVAACGDDDPVSTGDALSEVEAAALSGIIVEQGRTDQIFRDPQHPYTQGLLASLPTRSKRGQRLYSIAGSVPDPAHKPEGCPFHPRCPHAVQTCGDIFPDMCDYGHRHLARCPVLYAQGGPNADVN